MAKQGGDDGNGGTQYLEGLENKRRTFMKLAGGGAAAASLGSLTAIPVGAARTDDYCFQVDLVQNEAGDIRDPLDGTNKYNDDSRLVSWQWGNSNPDGPYTGEDMDNFTFSGACDVSNVSDVSFDFTNYTASVEVSVSNCSASSIDLALVTYAAPCGDSTNPNWTASTQNLFATTQQTISEGNNGTLTVDIPEPAPDFTTRSVDDPETFVSLFRKSGHINALQLTGGGGASVVHFTGGDFYRTAIPWDGTYNDDNWHHLAAVYDSSSGMTAYVDGTQEGTNDNAGQLNTTGSGIPWGVGCNPADPVSELYDGQLDDIAVYDRALSASEVGTLSGGGSVSSGLVSRWDFEEKVYNRYQDTEGSNALYLASGSNEPAEASERSGTVLDFDGTNHFAGISDDPSLDLTDQITISLFFKTTQAV